LVIQPAGPPSPPLWVVNLNDFTQKGITLADGDTLCGVNENSVIVRKSDVKDALLLRNLTSLKQSYESINLRTLSNRAIPLSDAWWFPQNNWTVDLDHQVSGGDGDVYIRDVGDNKVHLVTPDRHYGPWVACGDTLYLTGSDLINDGHLVIKKNLKSGEVETVLNYPSVFPSNGINQNYFLEVKHKDLPAGSVAGEAGDIRVELVPIEAMKGLPNLMWAVHSDHQQKQVL